MRSAWGVLGALLFFATPCMAAASPPAADATGDVPAIRSGREIYASFRAGLADPSCVPEASARWSRHYAAAPGRMAASGDDVLSLFGYVVDALREADLPTEYALIPFVESGYKPGARSPGGPAGLWQFIAVTARNHKIPIRAGYDGRLSPVESTRAAVRYLKTLHGMFAGDWRLAVMAYNAGEYRLFGALKRSGQVARDADPEALTGLSGITRAYVRKLHALSCVLDQADDREEWLRALDRPVPVLTVVTLPSDTPSLDAWATDQQLDPAMVKRLNPAFAGGRIARAARAMPILAPITPARGDAETAPAATTQTSPGGSIPALPQVPEAAVHAAGIRTHTVSRGESAWTIAHRYELGLAQLLQRNGLTMHSVLKPGMVLQLDETAP